MGKHKKNKPKREKKQIIYRTKEERQGEIREIIKQLAPLELTPKYDPIKQLYQIFKEYIETGTLKALEREKANPIHENVISFISDFPVELGLDKYIDYDLQFEKAFLEPVKVILDAIGWNVEKVVNLELFFG